MIEKINIISWHDKRVLLDQDQYEMYVNKSIDRFCLPFKKDQYEKTPYVSRDNNVFTWEYNILLASGYKTKHCSTKFELKIQNNIIPYSLKTYKVNYANKYSISVKKNGIKIKSYDAVKSTLENGLPLKTNWYWELII